jgi:hypothetical protein
MKLVVILMAMSFVAGCSSEQTTETLDAAVDGVALADVDAFKVDTSIADTESAQEDTTVSDKGSALPPEDTMADPDTTADPDATSAPDTMAAPDTTPVPDTQTTPEDTQSNAPGSVTLAFRHMDKGWSAPLSYNETGTNTSGDSFAYDFLRYWVSNVSFKHVDGTSYAVPASYYLVEETPQNTRLDVAITGVPAGEYQSVTFSVGVDKEHNASLDLMEGELSVNVGMSWNWNTGYIFFKVEGVIGADNGKFKMHVGMNENYRVVTREFAEPVLIDADHPVKVWLRADISRLFDNLPAGPYLFSISPLAKTVADNYGSWFDAAEVTAP